MVGHWFTAHSQYFFWVADVIGGGLVTWKYMPLTFIRLVGALTKNPQRHRQCAEILRLARKDAASIPSYFVDPSSYPNPEAKPSVEGAPKYDRRQVRDGQSRNGNGRRAASGKSRRPKDAGASKERPRGEVASTNAGTSTSGPPRRDGSAP